MERTAVAAGRPVVVKIGSSSLATPGGGVDEARLTAFVAQVEGLWRLGHPTVVVTSGAIAAGLPALGLERRPRHLPSLQVAAAVGQNSLMAKYSAAFGAFGRVVGQVLLTRDILANRDQYVHSRAALEQMFVLGVVPVVNENDTVVIDELRWGDNDRLAAIVSHLVGASLLVLLTDTEGIYSGDPTNDHAATLLKAVRHTDEILDRLARGGTGRMGSGGIATKVAAARMAAWSGIPTVICSSAQADVLAGAVAGDEVGTWIQPHPSSLSARKLWIAFGIPATAAVTIDDGAVTALVEGRRSLLPVGVESVSGTFSVGDAVEILDRAGHLVAKGVVRAASGQLSDVEGPLVHRDDLVVIR